MALSPVEQVRLIIGDVPGSPFYPLYTDEQIQAFLDMNNQNVFAAARLAAISASFQLAGVTTRERTGDIEVWSSLSSQYLKALDYLIKNPGTLIPSNLIPWSSSKQMCNLTNIKICDEGYCNDACSCNEEICACNCSAGETF